ncbi:hypothetical protein STEG23_010957 [Scotinomys teguina]
MDLFLIHNQMLTGPSFGWVLCSQPQKLSSVFPLINHPKASGLTKFDLSPPQTGSLFVLTPKDLSRTATELKASGVLKLPLSPHLNGSQLNCYCQSQGFTRA